MATYNCGQKVENTLRSIFSQNEELFELIVLDNASTDDTLEYLKKYESDMTLVSEKDDGVYYAFNRGISLATGKYLYFIGAGDCLKPDILERIKEFLPPEIPSFVYGKCYFVKQKTLNGKEFSSELFIRDNLCQQGIFYHRDLFEIVGKYDLQYKVFADWLFNMKCFMHDRVAKRYIDYVIADYEEGGLSSIINRDPVFVREFPLFVKKHFGVFKSLLCRAFLAEPYVFNCFYYGYYRLLWWHWINNYSLPKRLISLAKSYLPGFETLKKAVIKRD